MSSLPKIGTLWIGGQLPDIEKLCIASMIGNGHEVTLYTYTDVKAPKGVAVKDASLIIPEKSVFTYKNTGSYATFADWFRLRMIAMTGQMWLDADAALLKPFDSLEDYFFVGADHKKFGKSVNNYVIRMPPDSRICQDALSHFDSPAKFLKYMAWHRSARISAKRAITGSWDLSQFRWGIFGMGVLTDLVHKYSLEDYIHCTNDEIIEGRDRIFAPANPALLESAKLVHFFSSRLRKTHAGRHEVIRGSIYERLNDLYG